VNVLDAAHKTAHGCAGGCDVLAVRMDMKPGVLRNKVNPNSSTHHLTLAEADEMMGLTGDHRILQALAAQHGYALVRTELPAVDGSLMSSVLAFLGASGAMSTALNGVLVKGQITKNASREIDALCADVQAALLTMARLATQKSGRLEPSA